MNESEVLRVVRRAAKRGFPHVVFSNVHDYRRDASEGEIRVALERASSAEPQGEWGYTPCYWVAGSAPGGMGLRISVQIDMYVDVIVSEAVAGSA